MTSPPPPRFSSVRATQAQGATFVELFFDLVFVFAVTQVTAEFRESLTAIGLVRALLVFWLVWWAWSQFSWALNAADTEHPGVRLGTLVATAVAFLMAVTVPDAFGGTGWWFGVAYIAVRLLGIGLYAWVAQGDRALQASVRNFTLVSAVGLVTVAIAVVLPAGPRTVVLAVAVALDLFAVSQAGGSEWRLFPAHFAERHGLFVIIALGEAVIAAGIASAEVDRTAQLAAVVVLAVAATCALWWTYFGRAQYALEQALHDHPSATRGRLARDLYTLGHFPVIAGVIAFAVAVEEAVAHPDEHLEPLVALALVVGVALFVGGVGLALLRAGHGVPLVRIVGVVVLAVTFPLLSTWPAIAALAIVTVIVAAIAVVERLVRGRRPA